MSLKTLIIVDNVYKGCSLSLSYDCQFDIDRDVSTAHCRFSSGDSVDLLSLIICNTLVVSAHGWWVSIQSIVGIVRGGN